MLGFRGGGSLSESSRSITASSSSSSDGEAATLLPRAGAALLAALEVDRAGAKLSCDCDGAEDFLVAGAFLAAGAVFLAGAFFFAGAESSLAESSDASLN